MSDRTEKDDWLNTSLAKDEHRLVSGHPTFSARLGIPDEAVATIRWCGNARVGYLPLLVIEAPQELWSGIATTLGNSVLAMAIRDILPRHPALTLFFSEAITRPSRLRSGQTFNEPNFFWVSNDGTNYATHDSEGLAAYFGKINGDYIANPGTTKQLNKSNNDAFQLWTGKNLSQYLLVSDFDAINLEEKILYELKRVKESVRTWTPYLDESSQYKAFLTMGQEAGYSFRLYAYNVNSARSCALHILTSVVNDAIYGSMKQIGEREWKEYRSTRVRKHRGY